MKYIVVVIITFMCLLGTVQLLYAFPPECDGKQVTCEMFGSGTCTLMYCPPTITYDKNGKVIATTSDCNQCSFTRQCWCEGHSFVITDDGGLK
jgi:hypothetical protein